MVIYITANTLLWAIGFALGLIFGFTIPIFGDMLAVLLVGVLVVSIQGWVLPDTVNTKTWIKLTSLGLVVGTALSFIAIILFYRLDLAELGLSHILAFPVILLGIVYFQYRCLLDITNTNLARSWVVVSILGLFIGMMLVTLLSLFFDFDLEQLDVRSVNYAAADNWALMGGILGLSYSLSTWFVLKSLTNIETSE